MCLHCTDCQATTSVVLLLIRSFLFACNDANMAEILRCPLCQTPDLEDVDDEACPL